MKNMPFIGLGIATIGSSTEILDVHFPLIVFKNTKEKHHPLYKSWDSLMDADTLMLKDSSKVNLKDDSLNNLITNLGKNKKLLLCRITKNEPIESIEEAYLKLHLLSYKYFKPNTLNLKNLFNVLPNAVCMSNVPGSGT